MYFARTGASSFLRDAPRVSRRFPSTTPFSFGSRSISALRTATVGEPASARAAAPRTSSSPSFNAASIREIPSEPPMSSAENTTRTRSSRVPV
jgi:hypothetical protein